MKNGFGFAFVSVGSAVSMLTIRIIRYLALRRLVLANICAVCGRYKLRESTALNYVTLCVSPLNRDTTMRSGVSMRIPCGDVQTTLWSKSKEPMLKSRRFSECCLSRSSGICRERSFCVTLDMCSYSVI